MHLAQALTSNPFGTATKKWVQDYMYPPHPVGDKAPDGTKVPAGMVVPQQRSQDASVHTYLCGSGLFEVFGTYDYENNKVIKTSIHFHVPFFGRLLIVDSFTRVLMNKLEFSVPADCAPITGKVYILPQGQVPDHPNSIGLGFDLTTPGYDNLHHPGLPLFPADPQVLSTKAWYKDVPLMENHVVSALRAVPETPVKHTVSNEHIVLAVDHTQNDEQSSLLSGFFSAFAVADKQNKNRRIYIPATPGYARSGSESEVFASKQQTVRIRFMNLFQLNGTINTETLYINAILSVFIPAVRSTHTCQIRGNLGDVAGVVAFLDEPLINGLVNLDCDPASADKTVFVTLKLSVSLIGRIKEDNYPLLVLGKQ
ncbi:hypothetical protein RhiXN_11210 [Rhizoctonia solani]|uniref:Uncharacterized protein n=2 Tax=Rhizoctonia solani TaxID=456999 RepID=A0A8H8P7G1_9AGAM|nr:uncharacterized protein RhiXN_11210 [Rhizoctonia solani]QRW26133.1 hypothetical protein RhiXN_11210 [Rhizoctonia solani]